MRNVIVTGANTGIGLETVRQLAEKKNADGSNKYRIYLACRDEKKTAVAIADVVSTVPDAAERVIFMKLDLADLESVKTTANSFLEKNIPLHVLVLNAGCASTNGPKTAQGYEMMFGVNHLGHFLFTKLLLPNLEQNTPSRIVVVSSGAHPMAPKDTNTKIDQLPHLDLASGVSQFRGYATSKLLNIWFTHELARRLEGTGVVVNCLHPGAVVTELDRNAPGWLWYIMVPIKKLFYITAPEGARTQVFLADDDSVEKVNGKYFYKCVETQTATHATDVEAEKKLWELSEKLIADFC